MNRAADKEGRSTRWKDVNRAADKEGRSTRWKDEVQDGRTKYKMEGCE